MLLRSGILLAKVIKNSDFLCRLPREYSTHEPTDLGITLKTLFLISQSRCYRSQTLKAHMLLSQEAALRVPFGVHLCLKKEVWFPTPQQEKPEETARGGQWHKYVTEEAETNKMFSLCCLKRNRRLLETSLSEMVKNVFIHFLIS